MRIQNNAPVTLGFFFLSLAALLLGIVTGGTTTTLLFSVYRSPFSDPLTFVRLIGHVLGHASWQHFMSNMLLFLVTAPPMEEKYGGKKLAFAILLTALVTGLVHYFFFPASALLGASGVVFMLIMLSSVSGVRGRGIPMTMILVAVLYLGQEICSLLFVHDQVSNLTHILGGLIGMLLGFIL